MDINEFLEPSQEETVPEGFQSGFVSIIGRPNMGKSTLMNQLVKEHISIATSKPQTTRNKIQGVANGDGYQAILIDTPGIHLPRNELHRRIVNYAIDSLREADLIFFIVEPFSKEEEEAGKRDFRVLENLNSKKNVILLVNKIDIYKEEEILETIEIMNQQFSFSDTIPISALSGKGVDNLEKMFKKYLPVGQPYYPLDQLTDSPERFIVAEFIREQLFIHCSQEIPYGIAVVVEAFRENEETGKIEIFATIFVSKQSHKSIIIGKGGSMLKRVGTYARKKMVHLLGTKVFLSLHVKVQKNWMDNPRVLNEFGYDNIK